MAKHISEGLAKDDDPEFKEGWFVFVPQRDETRRTDECTREPGAILRTRKRTKEEIAAQRARFVSRS